MIIRFDADQIRELREALAAIEKGAVRAIASALNKTASKAKTTASTLIRKEVKLTAAYVRDHLEGPNDLPANKATFTRLKSAVSIPHRGLLLSQYASPGQVAVTGRPLAPISVQIKPSGGKKQLPSAFWIPRLRSSGAVGIAMRNEALRETGYRGKYGTKGYTVLHAASLSQVFSHVKDDEAEDMSQYLSDTLVYEIQRILEQYGGDSAGPGPGE